MRIILFALTYLVLAGCVTLDEKTQHSSFEPTDDGFKFKTHAYGIKPVDSPDAEQWRMGILADYLSENRICPAGYNITSRNPVHVSGPMYDIYYTGRCK